MSDYIHITTLSFNYMSNYMIYYIPCYTDDYMDHYIELHVRLHTHYNFVLLFLLKATGPAGAGARSRAFPQAPQHNADSTSENEPPWTDVRPVQRRSAAGPCWL